MSSSQETLAAARNKWLTDEHEAALQLFREALHAEPNDLRLAVEVASYLGMRFEIDEATEILERCERQLAGNVSGLYQVGLAYERAFRPDAALNCFQAAVQSDPDHYPSWLKIVEWNERRGLLQEAVTAMDQCPRAHPEARLAFARLRRRLRDFAEAEQLLTKLTAASGISDELRIQAWYELAGLYDRDGQADQAFEAATAAKQLQRAQAAGHLRRAQELARLEANFVTTVTDQHYQHWSAGASHRPVALLTGSPRSGTTLMARVLGNHVSIHLADEINAYATYVHKQMLAGKRGDSAAEALDSLSSAHLAECRSRYLRWMFAATEGDGVGILLDKNPSTTFLIPAFRRLFPHAAIVWAIRDPRDVVISCYLQSFPLNPVSAMFSQLDLTVMRCRAECEAWLRLRDKLTPPWSEIRYEQLASGDEDVLKPTLAGLNVDWQPNLSSFQHRLKKDPVRSPTYAQLFDSINTQSVGRWRAYEQHLRPYLGQLDSVCRALGYASVA